MHSRFSPRFSPLSSLAALLITCLLSTATMAAPEVHVFELENRRAESVLGQLQALYQDTGVVFSPDGQKLMVRAEAEQLAEIDQLLRTLDVAARQLRVSLREVTGTRTGSNDRGRTLSTSSQRQQTLTMQDGQVASIRSGQLNQLPVAVRGGTDPVALLEQVDQSSGFLVQANVISNQQVELQITALKNDPIVGMPGHKTAAVVTMRRVSPGEWITLGEESRVQETQQDQRVISTGSASDRSWQIKLDLLD
ncbi:MAG: hypothetical protein EA349_06275 [Halomonadaceae bacterium]|nr:MAG: hypothetical protein EA349_06275 [Halomonadaceae bacterium]